MNSSSAASTRRLIDTLAHGRVVAILRATHAGHLVAAAEGSQTPTSGQWNSRSPTPGALQALRELRDRRPELLAGAGTVITPADVAEAHAAGAQFLVAPCEIDAAEVARAAKVGHRWRNPL